MLQFFVLRRFVVNSRQFGIDQLFNDVRLSNLLRRDLARIDLGRIVCEFECRRSACKLIELLLVVV